MGTAHLKERIWRLSRNINGRFLEQSRRIFHKTPISQATERAYLATPRHLFVRRYREWGTTEWRQVTAENLEQHLRNSGSWKPVDRQTK